MTFALLSILLVSADVQPPAGFRALFNGVDFNGWHAMPHFDPRKLAAMPEAEREQFLKKHTSEAMNHWTIKDGALVNDGHGAYLTTDREFGDIEFLIEYRTVPKADSGIYLRTTPQVQIWDQNDEDPKNYGKKFGSGGLWNNSPGAKGKDPLVVADKPLGEWNKFRIIQIGARTTVYLNDKLVVDDAVMENYWDRNVPLFAKGKIQLQTHGGEIAWRNLFIREIPADEANKILREKDEKEFTAVFNGKDLSGWAGPVFNYEVVDGAIRCRAGKGGTIYTAEEYNDFVARVEFKLPPGGNNGLAIRYPGDGDTAYVGMCEIQILDDTASKYSGLDPRQFNGSAYGMAAPVRGYLRPVGEWNYQQVTVKGSTIKVELNGTKILDTDLSKVEDYMGGRPHPGKDRSRGAFGFAGHGDPVMFRNVSIKKL